jgi:hypothetical protein
MAIYRIFREQGNFQNANYWWNKNLKQHASRFMLNFMKILIMYLTVKYCDSEEIKLFTFGTYNPCK